MSRYRGNADQTARPEIAFRKATELYNNERKEDALITLTHVLKNKKYKTWQQNYHPDIYALYITICVDLKESQKAKDGLYMCKSQTQHNQPDELAKAMKQYLALAKKQVASAKKASKESADALKDSFVDLEESLQTPEELLKSVTANSHVDRADRTHLMPWYKFLWDAYKQCLDILSVYNNKMEKTYYEIALEACDFCVENTRTNEFRRLGDTLRNHLKTLTDLQNMRQKKECNVTLVAAQITDQHHTSQKLQTEIRHKQLKSAIQLKLWQECSKTIDDLALIQQYTKKVHKSYANSAKFKSKFLNLISEVCEKSGSSLLHAAAMHRIFQLNRDMKSNDTEEEKENLKKLASQTLVATLAIPLTEKHPGLKYQIYELPPHATEKQMKWCRILNYERMPTREELVQDIQYKGVNREVPYELGQLYHNIEKEFNPERLSQRVDICLKWLANKEENSMCDLLAPYIKSLQHVTASRVISQCSKTYEAIRFEKFLNLVPFYNAFELEQHILDDCRSGRLRAKLDHSARAVHFGSQFDPAPLCIPTAEDTMITDGRGERDWLNQHLNSINTQLTKAFVMLQDQVTREARAQAFTAAAKQFRKYDDFNCQEFSRRQKRIEDVLQVMETKKEREREEKIRQMEIEQKLKREKILADEEKAREDREKIRSEKETKENAQAYFDYKLEELKKDEKALVWSEHIDTEDCMTKTIEEIAEKQLEGVKKQRIEAKKALSRREDEKDYHERAKKQEEQKWREQHAEARDAKRQADHERMVAETLRKSREDFEENQLYKAKFLSRKAEIDKCTVQVEENAQKQYEKEVEAYEAMKLESIAEKRIALKEDHKHAKMERFKVMLTTQREIIKAYEEFQARKAREDANRERLRARQAEEEQERARQREQMANRPPVEQNSSDSIESRRPRRFIGKSNMDNDPDGFRKTNEPRRDNSGERPFDYVPTRRRDDFGGGRWNSGRDNRDDGPRRDRMDDRDWNNNPRDGPRRFDDGPRRGGFNDDGPRRGFNDDRRDGPARRFRRSPERDDHGAGRRNPSGDDDGGWRRPVRNVRPESANDSNNSGEPSGRRPRRFIGKKDIPKDESREPVSEPVRAAPKPAEPKKEVEDEGWTKV